MAQPFVYPAAPVTNWVDKANITIQDLIGSPCNKFIPTSSDLNHITVYNIFKPILFDNYFIINEGKDVDRKFLLSNIYNYLQSYPVIGNNAATNGLIPAHPQGQSMDDYIDGWYTHIFGDESAGNECNLVIQGGEAVNMYSVFRHENVPTHDCDTRLLAGNHFNYHTSITDVDPNVKLRMHKYRFLIFMGLAAGVNNLMQQLRAEYWIGAIGQVRTYLRKFPKYNGTIYWDDCLYNQPGNPIVIVIGATNLLNQLSSQPPSYAFTDDVLGGLGGFNINIDNNIYGIVDLYIPRLTNCNTSINCVGHTKNIHSFFQTEQSKSCTNNNTIFLTRNGSVPYIRHTYSSPMHTTNRILLRIVPHGYLFWDTLRMLLVSHFFVEQNKLPGNNIIEKLSKYKQKINCLLSTTFRGDISNQILDTCTANKVYSSQVTSDHLMGGSVVPTQMNQSVSTPNFLEETMTIKQPVEMSPTNPQSTTTSITEQLFSSETDDSKIMFPEEKVETPELSEQFIRGARAFARQLIASGVPFEEVDTTKFTNQMQFAGYMEWMSYLYGGYSDYRLPVLPGDTLIDTIDPILPTPTQEIGKPKVISKQSKQKLPRKLNQTRSIELTPRQQSSIQLQKFRRTRRKSNRR